MPAKLQIKINFEHATQRAQRTMEVEKFEHYYNIVYLETSLNALIMII